MASVITHSLAGLAAGAITLILTAFFVAPMIDALPQTRERSEEHTSELQSR